MKVSALRTFVAFSGFLICVYMSCVRCAMLWCEEAPKFNDPCTTVVVSQEKGEYADVHLPLGCQNGSILWLGSFGRIHVWMKFGSNRTTVQNFEFCLTAGSPERIYIWWDTGKNSWSPISFPLKIADLPKRDVCKESRNGTMDIYLEPPWAFPQYMSYFSYNFTFVEEREEQETTAEAAEAEDDSWFF